MNQKKSLGTKTGINEEVAEEATPLQKKIAKGAAALKRTPPPIVEPPVGSRLSTGCSLLNLACSGNAEWAIHGGQYVFFVGDSGSGKTMLVLQLFAEAARNAFYDKHKLIYDNPENGALMDLEKFFGKRAASRIQGPPRGTSTTIEQLYYNLDDAVEEPVIYILDSMDALGAKAAEAKFQKQKNARPGTKVAGSMGMDKAKANSERLRPIVQKLVHTNSVLVIISQTRDKTDAIGFQSKKTRAGGHALEFYAHLEIWTNTLTNIMEKVGEKKLQTGIICQAKVKKNRVNGFKRVVEIPIYPSVGIDEVGSMVEYLVAFGAWKENKGKVTTSIRDDNGEVLVLTRDEIISYVEENGIEAKLRELTQRCWDNVEERIRVDRKPRYE